MNNQLNVTVGREGNYDDYNELRRDDIKYFKSNEIARYTIMESIVRVELSKIIQPIILNTGMNLYEVCNTAIKNINLPIILNAAANECVSYNLTARWNVLKYLIKNELYSIAVCSTSITKTDNGKHLFSLDEKLDYITKRLESISY